MRKTIIMTNDREIFNKLQMLKITDEVVLKNINIQSLKRIMGSINSKNRILDMEFFGEYVVIKKINPIDFNVYLTTP